MKKPLAIVLLFALILPQVFAFPSLAIANTLVRQEINITDAYYTAPSGSFATSSEIVLNCDCYTSPTYYFEVVASTTAATNATVSLVNATSSAIIKSITINGTSYQRYRSSAFTPTSSTTEYKVVLGNEAVGKGIIASRVVVLQNAATLSSTETQIEIGSATTTAVNTATLPLQSPKYWYYDSAKWDASPTFSAEVTYKVTPVASSTTYNASATTTSTFFNYVGSAGVGYVNIQAWGPGGGGDGVTSAATLGGGGGGGGAFAMSTTSTITPGDTSVIGIGRGGAEGTAATASSTVTQTGTIIVQAAGGTGATSGTGAAGGTTAASTGNTKFAGGKGGDGETTKDIGGGGGGSAGPDGAGGTATNAVDPNATAGAQGDNGFGGAGGAAGTGNNDTCANADGKAGANNVLGAGGGGGASGDATGICVGGSGGKPGGGGGGSDEGVAEHLGGPGQVKITEYIGTVGIALQEDDGQFTWSFLKQVVTAGKTSTTTDRARVSFTPTNGKHYRLVASTTNATASYNIYNAKIVVDQGGSTTSQDQSLNGAKFGATAVAGSGGGSEAAGQTITAGASGTLTEVDLLLFKTGLPTDNLFVEIGDGSITGATLSTSANVAASTLSTDTTNGAYVAFTFSSPASVTSGNVYGIRLFRTGARDASNAGTWIDTTTAYANGIGYTETSAAWVLSEGGVGWDRDFKTFVQTTYVPTLLEPQYLLAPFKLPSGVAAQSFFNSFDAAEWSTTNNYLHGVSAGDNSTSVVQVLNASTSAAISGSIVTSPDNYATSTGLCMFSTRSDFDTQATTNNNDVYSSSVLVQVGVASTATGCTAAATVLPKPRVIDWRTLILKSGKLIVK